MAPVWPKFFAAVALLFGLALSAIVVIQAWSNELVTYALVPRTAFVAPPPLPSGAYVPDTLWLARPDAKGQRRADDPSRLIPDGWSETPARPSRAAVFFVPTTTSFASGHWNDTLNPRDSRARDRIFVGLQASAFNLSQVWAPLYRQAVIGAFLGPAPSLHAALDVAYGDVRQAFDAFIAAQPRDRPIVLAGHGQGALLVLRLLHDRIAGQDLADRVVAVYVVGWPIGRGGAAALGLPACTRPDESGCVIGWVSFAEPADPAQLYASTRNAPIGPEIGQGIGPEIGPEIGKVIAAGPPYLCTNPLNGGSAPDAPASANLGTLMPNAPMTGGTIARGLVPARCDARGLLLIGKPLDLKGYVLPGNNYSAYDIPLFWANLRADVARREAAWQERRDHHGTPAPHG